MPFAGTGTIWMNGSLVNWADAKIHIASHVIHYGSGVFEGARCYDTPKGSACFRLDAHIAACWTRRRSTGWSIPLGIERLSARRCSTRSAPTSSRPATSARSIYRGYDAARRQPARLPGRRRDSAAGNGAPTSARRRSRRAWTCASARGRAARRTRSRRWRSRAANYANSSADQDGSGARRLHRGHRARRRRPRQRGQRRRTSSSSATASSTRRRCTRRSCRHHARLGHDASPATSATRCARTVLPREALYIADEVFFAGTAAEVTPIRSVDKIVVGPGKCGPITQAIQTRFFDIVERRAADTHGWLTYVYPGASGADTKIREKVVTG